MKRCLAVSAILACISAPAFAGDENGKYAVKGVGVAPCSEYVTAIGIGPERADPFVSWLAGYTSAWNAFLPETFDLVSWQPPEFMIAYLREYCARNPNRPFYMAAQDMLDRMRVDRIVSESRLVKIETDAGSADVYEAIIAPLNARLVELGFLEGEAPADYAERTIAAVKAFQERYELDATGAPDPDTVYQIMYGSRLEANQARNVQAEQ